MSRTIKLTVTFLSAVILISLTGCGQGEAPIPKPRAYPRVDFPVKDYQRFQRDVCPFHFMMPKYSKVIKDSLFFDEAPLHECWLDLAFPQLNGRIHLSYYPIEDLSHFEKLRRDAFELARKHQTMANYIDELPVEKENNVSGFIFEIEGPVASPFQFYLTDSTTHFLRGSLYFNTKADPDSLEPVYEFVKQDIARMIESFEWAE